MADQLTLATNPDLDPNAGAKESWDRYRYVITRGHRSYCQRAQYCERMYLGAGRQWDADEAAALIAQKRKPREFNEILPSINAAVGHQIRNRLDISFRPRGGNADQIQADIRSKVIMQINDQAHFHWKETEVFSDGLIQQRGYYDVRMVFGDNMQGNLRVEVCDPMDIIPDPDAKTYEPAGWEDVIRTRWLTEQEIANDYGQDKADLVMASLPADADFGQYDDSGALRAKFADPSYFGGNAYDAYYSDGKIRRARVVERQQWVNSMSRVLFYPSTGEQKLAENLLPEVIHKQIEAGAVMTRAVKRRVKWVASTYDITLHDDWSPYNRFTIIPYFAFFRRGQTLGLVDNAIDPQQARNKALSNFEHILGSAANSGWKYEENSLNNMTTKEFAAKGAMTGVMLEVKKGSQYPEKIQPSQVPTGHDRYIEQVTNALKSVTVPDAMRGSDGPDTSGLARQTQQFAAQQQIAVPLDNLARTRHLYAEHVHELAQQFISEERTFRITETDFRTGKPVEAPITVNQYDPATGGYVNDLTEGEYDVVISDQPIASTFEESQFNQAMEMRKQGVAIPDSIIVQASNLSRKAEVLDQMQGEQKTDPLMEAKAALLAAQARKTDADAVQAGVTAEFSATQAANQIVTAPGIAPLADALLMSAGFKDANAAPIVPNAPAGIGGAAQQVPQPQANTSPNMPAIPASPAQGADAGIERMDPAQGQPR